MTMKRCIVCSSPVISVTSDIDNYFYNCYRCGVFSLTQYAAILFPDSFNSDDKKSLLSGWLRRNQGYKIQRNDIKTLLKIHKPSIPERATDLLRYISILYPDIGQTFNKKNIFQTIGHLQDQSITQIKPEYLESGKYFMPMMAESWSKNQGELRYLINDYLIGANNYLHTDQYEDTKITPFGWAHLDEIRNKNIYSDIAFIASKYDESTNAFLDKYVVTAIENAGYNAKLMRTHKHTNIIDDEMLSLIRKSKFIIADLTFNSKGAYYEAGFAHGFGLPVIFTCEDGYFKNRGKIKANSIHFDVNHYPINRWVDDNGKKAEKFKKDLQNYIIVNFKQGNYKKEYS